LSTPGGINLEMKFVYKNTESINKVFSRRTNVLNISDSKNFYDELPKNQQGDFPISVETNISLDLVGPRLELCETSQSLLSLNRRSKNE
jgi:hypothetical protein